MRIVDPNKIVLVLIDRIQQNIRDLSTFHPRALFKRQQVRRDLDVLFGGFVKFVAAVTVKEVSHVAVFLSLTHCQLCHTGVGQVLSHYLVDRRRRDQVVFRNLLVGVVLHDPRKLHVWNRAAIKFSQFRIIEGS